MSTLDLDKANSELSEKSASQITAWAHKEFGDGLMMSTSFGVQSAVMLHLVTRVVPNIPIVFIDTGYLFPDTYRFAQALTERLTLNLKVYQSPMSPARMEAIYGKLWEMGEKNLDRYHRIRKVEPMQVALKELGAKAWLAGLRAEQTDLRSGLNTVELQNDIYKVHPILGWNAKTVHDYLEEHELPRHPLWDQNYVSVGDWHSSRPISVDDLNERDTRFGGKSQECGLHNIEGKQVKSFESSGL